MGSLLGSADVGRLAVAARVAGAGTWAGGGVSRESSSTGPSSSRGGNGFVGRRAGAGKVAVGLRVGAAARGAGATGDGAAEAAKEAVGRRIMGLGRVAVAGFATAPVGRLVGSAMGAVGLRVGTATGAVGRFAATGAVGRRVSPRFTKGRVGRVAFSGSDFAAAPREPVGRRVGFWAGISLTTAGSGRSSTANWRSFGGGGVSRLPAVFREGALLDGSSAGALLLGMSDGALVEGASMGALSRGIREGPLSDGLSAGASSASTGITFVGLPKSAPLSSRGAVPRFSAAGPEAMMVAEESLNVVSPSIVPMPDPPLFEY